MSMPRRDEVWWAKETVLIVLDREIERLNHAGTMVVEEVDLDMLTELLKQRNRVARMLRLQERTLYPRKESNG